MTAINVDQEKIKLAVLEIIKEQPEILEPIVAKYLTSSHLAPAIEKALKQLRVSKMIDEDFDEYDEVFKSLA